MSSESVVRFGRLVYVNGGECGVANDWACVRIRCAVVSLSVVVSEVGRVGGGRGGHQSGDRANRSSRTRHC